MESLLSGIPQYIIASINILITINQSTYIMGLERLIADRIRQTETDGITRTIKRHKENWHLLIAAWWMLASTAVALIIFRIIPSMYFDDATELTHPWFIAVDFMIIFGTLLGYFLLLAIAFRSWKWNSWQGKTGQDG
ncbi:MAG: hypothetical protein GWO07_02690 [Candidatus Dadabacteria bacterium]|nr:hypothetical protein [Candidatus Dadabacteria bacterium]NIS07675.1 hypothetical protein [Candidatus Dadabacteria bacterium]NIV42254.1 hypothetical protein [Candidatus Dadabacteria bacterium]NIX14761.1 hypothetical protein [Candidatus Dadabacteria bacterium]NIY21302.1 hypothetical protein [Candidatus Dadabacteria bacterium]